MNWAANTSKEVLIIHTWHWIGVGWVYSDFLIAPISCSSKLKCAKLMDGLVGRAPETCQAITATYTSKNLNIVVIWCRSLGWSTNHNKKPKENMRPNWLKINIFLYTDKMQLFAKFKKILLRGFRANLNFQKFKVALNYLRRIFLNFAKSCILSSWLQFNNKKSGSPSSSLSYKCLKLKLRVF